MSATTKGASPVLGYAPIRAYLQVPIDQADLSVAAIDARRDDLADRFHWAESDRERVLLLAAMQAYIDGWLAGYADALDLGRREGWREFKHRARRLRKARRRAPAA